VQPPIVLQMVSHDSTIRKFLRLPIAERHQLLEVTILLILVSCSLRIFPFRHVLRSLKALITPGPLFDSTDRMRSDWIAWAVAAASARIPFVTCLPSALVLQALLERSGQSTRVCFGVRPHHDSVMGSDPSLSAHAWVEDAAGRSVGRTRRGAFVPLVRFSDTQ
jgi:hypothetical protein